MTLSPKISVITVNFNMAKEIAATLDSVLMQNYPNFEFIVVDGASTDGSRDIIAAYGPRLARWISEPDRNLYDAMNKGVRLATGDWVLFMNCGDRFASATALSCMFDQDVSGIDVLYGHHIRHYPQHGIQRLLRAEPTSVLPLRMPCSHQSLAMRRERLLQHPFALELLAADYEALVSAYVCGGRFKMVDCIISIASVGGRSDTSRLRSLWERVLVLRRHGLFGLGLGLHYAGLMAWAICAAAAKKILPRSVVSHILERRPLRGLG